MKKINDSNNFVNMDKEEINNYFKDYSKEELMNFADINDIPYKKYYSKNKLLNYLVEEIDSTMMFKRIVEH